MNLAQYMAQNAQPVQEQQQTQTAQEALSVDAIAAKLTAEELLSLKAQTEAAIAEGVEPAQLLKQIIAGLFGKDSIQAANVAARIDAAERPGGYEVAIAGLRQQKRLLRQQQKKHEEQIKEIALEIEAANRAERALLEERSAADTINRGLIDVAEFSERLTGWTPDPEMIAAAGELFAKHRENHVAMGLLFGCLSEIIRKTYRGGNLDLVQMQELKELKEQVLETIKN